MFTLNLNNKYIFIKIFKNFNKIKIINNFKFKINEIFFNNKRY